MKRIVVICVFASLVLPLAWSLSGCQPQPAQPFEPPAPAPDAPELPSISRGVISCLRQLHNEAMQQIDAEIADLDNQITVIEEKELELEEIKTQIDEAVSALDEEVAQERLRTGGWWEFTMTEEELESYRNEYYELVEFELRWDARVKEGIWELDQDIAIRDRETGSAGTPELLQGELRMYNSELVDNKDVKIELQQESNRILTEVIGNQDAWEIDEISKGVYSVSGYGLGYTEQLSFGEWYCYQDSETIEPRSSASVNLKQMITGG